MRQFSGLLVIVGHHDVKDLFFSRDALCIPLYDLSQGGEIRNSIKPQWRVWSRRDGIHLIVNSFTLCCIISVFIIITSIIIHVGMLRDIFFHSSFYRIKIDR